jgi:hypothetical protein
MNTAAENKHNKNTDYSLITQRIENKILEGKNKEEIEKLLLNQDMLNKLPEKILLKWSNLARMNCSIDVAENIYMLIHKKFPKNEQAYEDHIEMLSLLNEKEKLIKISALAKLHISKSEKKFVNFINKKDENEIEKSFYPLENMRKNQELISYFSHLFSGRDGVFARQWHSKESGKQGYVPVRQKISDEDIEAHLSGRDTLGIYLIKENNTVDTGVIDADIKKEIRTQIDKKLKFQINREASWLVRRIKEISAEKKLKPLTEFSGNKGYHFWFFLRDNPDAGFVKHLLESLAREIKNDLQYFNLEVFPKQNHLSGKGLGNLVKLPLGIHKKSGKKSYFPECRSMEKDSQLEFIKKYKRQSIKEIKIHDKQADVKNFPVKKNSEENEVLKIKNLCPPLGQIISQSLNKKNITKTEEKIIYQTFGFLPQGRRIVHKLFQRLPDYNHHIVDMYLTKLKGTPLGCRKIHNITGYTGDYCYFEKNGSYLTPLLHLGYSPDHFKGRSEKKESLQQALENLKTAVSIVERYMN